MFFKVNLIITQNESCVPDRLYFSNPKHIFWASKNGYLEVVKYLIENGVDIHEQDDYSIWKW
ncbi:ankyrin repeat protein [Acanthamoeba polyphaga moumouvirus]|uniref:Ankyrin repeat protein n=1 Tax=Acanthamoeba polyphaga moumouvirus TaxID=1269028 RepID=L7RCQ1_9VIRU|nr:ankyrin repeat protein [Acanthamoeba polyphaga moumouvirus]AGC02394.1 ankyrin repeat protein [Acanthamoeba polyphaga moumouvirus]